MDTDGGMKNISLLSRVWLLELLVESLTFEKQSYLGKNSGTTVSR